MRKETLISFYQEKRLLKLERKAPIFVSARTEKLSGNGNEI
jgi:hypothetical protein